MFFSILSFILGIITGFFSCFDVQVFPDLHLTIPQILIGSLIFSFLISFLFKNYGVLGKSSDSNSGFGGYKPKHGPESYTPKHAKK